MFRSELAIYVPAIAFATWCVWYGEWLRALMLILGGVLNVFFVLRFFNAIFTGKWSWRI